MNERIIIKESAAKWNIFVTIGAAITFVICILALYMVISIDSTAVMWVMFAIGALVLTGVIYWLTAGAEIVVSNKRIYGKVGFGKRVDLPLDSISAVATTSDLTKGVSVSTSSGRITFYFLSNRIEIAEAIRELKIKDFPVIVVIDSQGNNLYETECLKYRKE